MRTVPLGDPRGGYRYSREWSPRSKPGSGVQAVDVRSSFHCHPARRVIWVSVRRGRSSASDLRPDWSALVSGYDLSPRAPRSPRVVPKGRSFTREGVKVGNDVMIEIG